MAARGGRSGRGRGSRGSPPSSSAPKTSSEKKVKELTGKDIAERNKKSKLAHLADIMESLPDTIATAIEKEANSMLELYQEIGLKSTPLARFSTTITKKNGTEELYTPGCVRDIKNPCT